MTGTLQLHIVGLMSGTSADGIDAAVVRLHPDARPELLHFLARPLPGELREPLLRLSEPGVDEIDRMGGLDRALGEAFADAAIAAVEAAGLKLAQIDAIGSHGQTVRHRPRGVDGGRPFTLQIGCPATIARRTGITTVADFRRADVAAGGEGAPLVPYAHRELFAEPGEECAVLNVGGIANLSWIGAEGEAIGFDTGPGNMVMDGLALALSDGRRRFDADGELAAAGEVCAPLLERLLDRSYFRRPPPKSTGREEFGRGVIGEILAWPDLSDADRLATAAELTARSVAESARFLPRPPAHWHVCGGGAANPHLMARLAALLAPAAVAPTDARGVPAAAVEAVSFALLAAAALRGEPNTLPSVTGAARASAGGHIAPGENWPRLLESVAAWTR